MASTFHEISRDGILYIVEWRQDEDASSMSITEACNHPPQEEPCMHEIYDYIEEEAA